MKRCFSCFKKYDEEYSVCPFCGQIEIRTPKEPIHLAPGTVLANRYVLGESVGSGGFGIVYKAWDAKLETIVAIKELFVNRLVTRAVGQKELIINTKSREEFEYRKARFLAEARAMAKFGSHKSILNVFEFFEENNTAYIVEELMNGIALNDYLRQNNGKIDIDFALLIANEIGYALKSIHNEGVIHRDIAPDNIFICTGKEISIKLYDFGAAKLENSTDDVVDIILKLGYSPAEQYDNSKNIGPWTDIYALGATLYFMLTGVKPDESTNRKIKDEVVSPHVLNPLVSENLSNAVMKAMAIEKHMRFKNVSEFLAAINGERKVTTLAKERKRKTLKRFVGIAAACLVLVAGVGTVLRSYYNELEAQHLKPADISVWFSVKDSSTEEDALNAVKSDFEEKFPGVTVELRAIPEAEYQAELLKAAENGNLPSLFESSGAPSEVLDLARNLDEVIHSEQFEESLFLDQYSSYYSNNKQIPLAIEVPVAYVVTNGYTYVDYTDEYFTALSDFGLESILSADSRHADIILANFGEGDYAREEAFLDNYENASPVLLSTTLIINEVRTVLTNYEKTYVYYDADQIYCGFTYEWSIGNGTENEIAASERLLSWMLGNVYQSYLMISECNDGQIPVNPICFESKIQAKYLSALEDIYSKFVFERNVE